MKRIETKRRRWSFTCDRRHNDRPDTETAAGACATAAEGGIILMASGIVTWVDASKNHGFITPDDGGADLFVDASGTPTLLIGATVDFDRRQAAKGRRVAANVVLRTPAGDVHAHVHDTSASRATP